MKWYLSAKYYLSERDFHENSGSEETLKANSYFFYLFEFLFLPVINVIQCSQSVQRAEHLGKSRHSLQNSMKC